MEKIFKCEYCGETFENGKIKANHIRWKHLPKEKGYTISEKWKKAVSTKEEFSCPFCKKEWITTKSGFTLHKKFCKENPNKIDFEFHCDWTGKKHTEETRKKISESMKKASEEGKLKGWSATRKNINGMSYPELWFSEVIKNEFNDKNYEYNFPFKKWKLDFAWPSKKLCIEIDGRQHNEEKQKFSDLKKDEELIKEGWKVFRLPWKYIFENSKKAISEAKDFIENGKIININWKEEKTEKEKERIKLKNEGRISEKGNVCKNFLSLKEKEERKELILSCGVNLNKFGWIMKVSRKTGLTKSQIYRIVKFFNLDVYKLPN